MCTLRSRISGGGSEYAGRLENCSRVNKRGRSEYVGRGWKCGLAMKKPAQIHKAPINITGKIPKSIEYFSESCHIYPIHYLGNPTNVPTFCRFLLKQLKGEKAGGLIRAGVGKFLEKNKRGGAYSGPKSKKALQEYRSWPNIASSATKAHVSSQHSNFTHKSALVESIGSKCSVWISS